MKEKRGDSLILLILWTAAISFIAAEIMIFYNHEARENWCRMLPCALMSPFMFMIAGIGAVFGVISLVSAIPQRFMEFVRTGNFGELPGNCMFAGVCLLAGGGTVYRWIKYIIIENYPAFGYNPDNVYAVAGLNTMIFMPMGAIGGLVLGLMFCALLFWLGKFIRLFRK